jgi:hypothetical protein
MVYMGLHFLNTILQFYGWRSQNYLLHLTPVHAGFGWHQWRNAGPAQDDLEHDIKV